MNLQIVGCSHHQSSIGLRERLAIAAPQIPEALSRFTRRFPNTEAVLLSTCNRTEFYTAADDPQAVPSSDAVADFLAEFHGLDPQQVAKELFAHNGEAAIQHLFMVAASLDSMVVGEAQILSQVKEAYRVAADGNSAGQLTHAAFQAALRVAKRVASETEIHQRRVSIPSIAVRDLACQIFERLDDKQVLVIGAGEMAEETVRYLMDAGARQIRLINRNYERAEQLADQLAGTAANWEQLNTLLTSADLVVSTTGATEPIVRLQEFREIHAARYQRPMFVLDLAVPRDFDPEIGELLGVYLYSLDDLTAACEANRKSREAELPRALRIIEEETARFLDESRQRATGPTIQQLTINANRIKESELDRLFNKLSDVDPATQDEIRYAFDRVVKKILHPPLESLREERSAQGHERLLDSLRRLFQLKE